MNIGRWCSGLLLTAALFLAPGTLHAQVGHVIEGAGVINRSMEGAATGNPIDMCGALYWNVAGLTQVKHSMFCMGTEFFMPSVNMSSSGPGWGPNGNQDSDMTHSIIPTIGFTYKPKDSLWTFGVGMQSIAGFGVEYERVKPGNPNPIFYPQGSGGFGGVKSSYGLGQMVAGAAYKMTPHLSLGIAPVLAFSRLEVDPFPGTRPNASGYPDVDKETAYGVGLEVGALYRFNPTWSVGVSHRSEVDFSSFDFTGTYPDGASRDFSFDLNLPSISSVGVGYVATDLGLTINLDLRYLDYSHTQGFEEDAEFGPNGAVKGFGWDSVWQIALGTQYKLSKCLTLRAGYSWNTCPIDSDTIFYNIQAPAIIQHHAAIGFSYQVTERLMLNVAYAHGFRNHVEGQHPGIPGSKVEADMSTDSLMLGIGLLF